MMDVREQINIRPQVSVLSVLKHLNYEPWYALAEFVDNAIQSYREHEEELRRIDGEDYRLNVRIELDTSSDQLIVRDNAAGIFSSEYERAFRPAEIPPDTSGLSEFGMGMKSAACWFAPLWKVRTTALGEPVERTVRFNVEKIVEAKKQEVSVDSREAKADAHYTVVTLDDLHRVPHGRTIGKIKDHLASIYRKFTREGIVDLRYNGERLRHEQPDILEAAYYEERGEGEPKRWKKDIEFDFGGGLSVEGFAAIRAEGSTSKAGFSLFRRGRVVEGSGDQKYRPKEIFGTSNSYRYQRIFGELHLSGFEVSHTKDGFVWEDEEQPFLELLREKLDEEPLPLLKQAEGYRARAKPPDESEEVQEATKRTADALAEAASPILEEEVESEDPEDAQEEMPPAESETEQVREVELNGVIWRIALQLSSDPSLDRWVDVSDSYARQIVEEVSPRDVGVRLALDHPFTKSFVGPDGQNIEPLIRIAAAMGVGETAARDSGVRRAGHVRRVVNRLLREALSTIEE